MAAYQTYIGRSSLAVAHAERLAICIRRTQGSRGDAAEPESFEVSQLHGCFQRSAISSNWVSERAALSCTPPTAWKGQHPMYMVICVGHATPTRQQWSAPRLSHSRCRIQPCSTFAYYMLNLRLGGKIMHGNGWVCQHHAAPIYLEKAGAASLPTGPPCHQYSSCSQSQPCSSAASFSHIMNAQASMFPRASTNDSHCCK